MPPPRIIVTRKLPAPVEERLRQSFTVALNRDDTPFPSGRLIQALQQADGLICTSADLFDETILEAGHLRRARIVANAGASVDNIDLDAAEARGITVTSTPGSGSEAAGAAAELVLALLLATARRMGEAERALRSGAWTPPAPGGHFGAGLQGRTLGLAGMGPVGREIARRAAAGFGMKVIFHGETEAPPAGATRAASLDALLETADTVCLTGETETPLTEDHLARMKRGAHLVGAGGAGLAGAGGAGLVDMAALAEALRSGKLAGAGLDLDAGAADIPPGLTEHPNVTLLPGIATATMETRAAMGMRAVDNLDAFFAGLPLPGRVV